VVNLQRFGDENIIELTDEDKQQIRELSRQPDIAEKVFNSIAPSIYGY
jgi:DNA replicative helicase MCM subunit Mcm2 (Cdc46/Mcm family)